MTTRQMRILGFIVEYQRQNGYPPSIRDIQDGCNISSTSVVSYNRDQLVKRDMLRTVDGVSRSLVVTQLGRDVVAGLAT